MGDAIEARKGFPSHLILETGMAFRRVTAFHVESFTDFLEPRIVSGFSEYDLEFFLVEVSNA